MNTEDKLKELILSRYKSIREFTLAIDFPYTTLDSIFKRGIGNSSITNVLKICNALHISADALADGRIEPVYDVNRYDASDVTLNSFYDEIGEMHLTDSEIRQLRSYAKMMRDHDLNYGKVIKEARMKKGYTIDQLAEKIGVAPDEVRSYENNELFPANKLKEIYFTLDITYFMLLGIRQHFDETYQKIYSLELSSEDLLEVYRYAKYLKEKKP